MLRNAVHPSLSPLLSAAGSLHLPPPAPLPAANLRTKILDLRRFDSSAILDLRGGIPIPIGNSPESFGQAILAGTILVYREIGRISLLAATSAQGFRASASLGLGRSAARAWSAGRGRFRITDRCNSIDYNRS